MDEGRVGRHSPNGSGGTKTPVRAAAVMRPAFLVAALLLAPAASACDLVAEPRAPARFFVLGLDGQAVWDGVVTDRGLGADCSLSNRGDLDGQTFAWMEGDDIHVVDLGSGGKRVVRAPEDPFDLTLAGGKVVLQTYDWADGARRAGAYRLDGEAWTPIVLAEGTPWRLAEGGIALWWTSNQTATSWTVQDLVSGAVLVEDDGPQRWGLPEASHPTAVNARWVAAHTEAGIAVAPLLGGAAELAPKDLDGFLHVALAGDELVLGGWSGEASVAARYALPGMEPRGTVSLPASLLGAGAGAGGGVLLAGDYSVGPGGDGIPSIPAAGWLPTVLAAVAIALLRRQGQRVD